MDELTIEQAKEMLFATEEVAEYEQAAEGEGAVGAQADVRDGLDAEVASPDAELDAVAGSSSEQRAAEAAAPAQEPNVKDAVGLGVDIVEIERMAALIERSPHFTERVFSEQERAYCEVKSNPAAHYAARFAAKEAVVKALGTGFAQGIGVRDIEVKLFASGKPTAVLSGRAQEVAEERGVRELSISLTYTHTEAVACALAITEASVRASEERVDPMEELAKKFKETRSILDEL